MLDGVSGISSFSRRTLVETVQVVKSDGVGQLVTVLLLPKVMLKGWTVKKNTEKIWRYKIKTLTLQPQNVKRCFG